MPNGCDVCHAELNAIMNTNGADVKGCSMYVTLFPCNECAKLIIQGGIKEVIHPSDMYEDRDEFKASKSMLEVAGIKLRRDDYLKDSKYFMDVALLAAKRSKDPNTQVGACIVNQENKIVGIGHNRMPNGCDDKLTWDRDRTKDNKHLYVCHAELNAIMNTNGADVKGCSMYVTLFPCNECAKLIIQGGMKEVIYLSDKSTKMKYIASRKMLKKADIDFRQFEGTEIVNNFSSNNKSYWPLCYLF
ncbi:deoxycytidylate deaminase isoform X2 [Labrus bergylta]|uniref:deoxycytidylate deaminase isoform X2 n=1 Tax=Labrus bergylta TaxID=56723 RepID=UPI00331420FC